MADFDQRATAVVSAVGVLPARLHAAGAGAGVQTVNRPHLFIPDLVAGR